MKGELLSACRKCKPNFYINESLTPTRSVILYALRKAKRMSPGVVAGCNSENGRVYAYVKNCDAAGDVTRNKKLLINTQCNNVLKVPVSSLISEWPQWLVRCIVLCCSLLFCNVVRCFECVLCFCSGMLTILFFMWLTTQLNYIIHFLIKLNVTICFVFIQVAINITYSSHDWTE